MDDADVKWALDGVEPGSIAMLGDVNGDGFDELVFGAYGDGDPAAAHLFLGTDAGESVPWTGADVVYSDVAVGGSLVPRDAGDVDADGLADLLLGSGYDSYLFLGKASPVSAAVSDADAEFYCSDWARTPVSAGDFDGDGFGDIAGGCGDWVSVVLGAASPSGGSLLDAPALYSLASASYWNVDAAGDVDGDGFGDVVLGYEQASSAGLAYLLVGSGAPSSGALSDFALALTGELPDDYCGDSVAGAGDFNADGYDDVLIGASENDDGVGSGGGAAYLWLGSALPASGSLSTATEYTGSSGEGAGISVSGAGDVDADGFDDLFIGASGTSEGDGTAYLVRGGAVPASASLSAAAAAFTVPSSTTRQLESVSGGSDFNGDGYDDLLVLGYVAQDSWLIFGNGI